MHKKTEVIALGPFVVEPAHHVHMVNVADAIEATEEGDLTPSALDELEAVDDVVAAAGGYGDSAY